MMDWLSHFHFLRPAWLFLCLFPMVFILVSRVKNHERRLWSVLIRNEMQPHMLLQLSGRDRLSVFQWLTVTLLVAGIALAGPTWQREIPEGFEFSGNVYVIIDSRPAMNTDDIKPTRLQHAKHKLAQLAQQQPGLQFSLFAYADTAHQVTPASADWAFHDLYLQALSPSIMPVMPLARGQGLEEALNKVSLEIAKGQQAGSVLLVTSQLSSDEVVLVKNFASSHSIQVWPVGRARGGNVSELGEGNPNRLGNPLTVSQFRELQRHGVPVTLMETDGSDLSPIIAQLERTIRQSGVEYSEFPWADYGRFVGLLLLPLMIFWFRKGVRVLPVLVVFFMTAPEANASWDWFFTPQQQGQIAFNRGDYAKAAELYQDPLRRGTAFYYQQQWMSALENFQQVDSDEGRHYLALTYAELKYWDEAHSILSMLAKRYPDDDVIQTNYAAVAAVMAELEELRQQRLDDQLMKQDIDDADGFVHSELAEQGVDATLDISDSMVSPKNWLEGLDMTPSQLLHYRFQLEAREVKRND